MELVDTSSRQLIPRWHASRKMAGFSWVDANFKRHLSGEELAGYRIDEAIFNWRSLKNLGTAVELYTKLLISDLQGVPEFHEVEAFLKTQQTLTKPLRKILSKSNQAIPLDPSVLYTVEKAKIHAIISRLKKIVEYSPWDALSWSDMAFYYAALGIDSKATRCLKIALQTSGRHPILARSYASFLVAKNDPEAAVGVIRDALKVSDHPFLHSAEFAIKEQFDLPGRNVAKARKILDRFSTKPDLITELAATIGTQEIFSGSTKKGRKLLELSMVSPTENVLSQAHWLRRKFSLDFGDKLDAYEKTLEARLIDHYENERFRECRETLIDIHEFQPFSPQAMADAGYVSLTALDDAPFVIEFYRENIQLVSSNFATLNNMLVALLEVGELRIVIQHLPKLISLQQDEYERTVMAATSALALFKVGDIAPARLRYDEVVRIFRHKRIYGALAIVLFHYGKEELEHDRDKGLRLLRESLEVIKERNVSRELKGRIEKLIN